MAVSELCSASSSPDDHLQVQLDRESKVIIKEISGDWDILHDDLYVTIKLN